MSTEEEIKGIIERVRSPYITQLLLYQLLWKKCCDKFVGMPFGVNIIPKLTETVKSVMDKVEEFNKAVDEKEERNPREIPAITGQYPWMANIIDLKSLYPNIVLSSEDHNEEEWTEDKIVREITLEDLEKELEDDGKEVELEVISGIGNWLIGIDTDTMWFSEMEQNPAPPPVPHPLEEAGDGPAEVGRQMLEALERRNYGLTRREGETDEEYRRRVANSASRPGRIRGTPNRMRGHGGAVFLAHQREAQRREPREYLCPSCERIGCSRERCEDTKQVGECPGYVDKNRYVKHPDIYCVICDEKMDSPENFPKGFPDIWKACCYCVETWSIMNDLENNLVGMGSSEIEERWLKNKEKMEEVFIL